MPHFFVKRTKKVTIKQRLVAKNLSENIGKPVGKAMREAGYAESTSKSPALLTKSKNWPILVEKYLPDKLLARKHKQLLTVPKKIRRYVKGDLESEVEELDTNAISKGLDMVYKVRGKYPTEKDSGDTNVAVVNVIHYSLEENETIEAEVAK